EQPRDQHDGDHDDRARAQVLGEVPVAPRLREVGDVEAVWLAEVRHLPRLLQRGQQDADDRHEGDDREHAQERVGGGLLAAVDHRAASRSATWLITSVSTKISAAMQMPIADAVPTSPPLNARL